MSERSIAEMYGPSLGTPVGSWAEYLRPQPSEYDVEDEMDEFSLTEPKHAARLLIIYRYDDLVDRWWDRWATVSHRYLGSWLAYSDSIDTYRRFRSRLSLDQSDFEHLFRQVLAYRGLSMIEEIGREFEGPIPTSVFESAVFTPTALERITFAFDRFDFPIVETLIFCAKHPRLHPLFPRFEGRIDFADPTVRQQLDEWNPLPESHASLITLGWRPPRSSPAFEEYRRTMMFPAAVAIRMFLRKWAKPFHLRYTIVV